ncbi:MAG: metal-dependent hydrolase [Hyphomicrobiales bacterium]|nr:metal-dependent hydrolase [Hyphomicrobiales bacterium]
MKLTWYGHSAFRIETGGKTLLIDPFLSGSPTFTGSVEDASAGCTHILLSHGHDDHVGDTVEIAGRTGATLIATFELGVYLKEKGVANVELCNPGGTITQDGFDVTFTKAFHSSSTVVDGKAIYLGAACGLIIRAGGKTVYHMGDTEIFGDMALVQELFEPDVGLVPIGDRFTMGAKQASIACKRYFKFKTIVPMHYGTFPIIEQDASKFLAEMNGYNVFVPEIGAAFDV